MRLRLGQRNQVKRLARLRVIPLPLGRWPHLPGRPVQQAYTKRLFERGDMPADVRLANVHLARHSGKAARFNRAHEAPHPQ
jgi:hypothetical protein